MFKLDENAITTKVLIKKEPIIKELKNSKFKNILFLLEGKGRQGEGGLRTKGYFKKSFSNKTLVSIVTAVFNGEEYLEETINSVINQTYDNIEYIIIDGGSTDGTLDIIKKYEDKIDYWVSEKDAGIYNAFNKGISIAQGEWISFLGADDIYLEDAIKNYLQYIINSYSEVDYVSSQGELVNKEGHIIKVIGKAWDWNEFMSHMKLVHVGSLHRKKLFERYGLYDEEYKIAGDYEFLLRSKSNLKAVFVPKVTVKVMVGGVSHEHTYLAYKEALRAKHETAQRALLICYFEYIRDVVKTFIMKKIKFI